MTMPREYALEAVEGELLKIRDVVGLPLFAKALAEIHTSIPPWASEGRIAIDAEAIRALMVMAWLRGHTARGEGLS